MAIPVIEKTKFHGLIFDHKRLFIPHLHYLKEKCLKAVNLLRVVAHRSTNTSTPLQISNKVKVGLWLHCVWFRLKDH